MKDKYEFTANSMYPNDIREVLEQDSSEEKKAEMRDVILEEIGCIRVDLATIDNSDGSRADEICEGLDAMAEYEAVAAEFGIEL